MRNSLPPQSSTRSGDEIEIKRSMDKMNEHNQAASGSLDPATKFRAFRVHAHLEPRKALVEELVLEDLDLGDLLVRVHYSSVNYKDAMAARGMGRNVRTDRSCVTGIDLAGIVVHSDSPLHKVGDAVIATNYDIGVTHDGGYADYARIPGEWAVPLPPGLDLFNSMALGTAGLTAALAVDRLESAGLRPANGAVVVTGASGGVGSLAVDMLGGRGYEVVALSRKQEQEQYLRSLGAAEVLHPDVVGTSSLGAPSWAAAVDTVGGSLLAGLIGRLCERGKVAVCGMAASAKLETTVLPMILRGVDLLGINVSRALLRTERIRLWTRLGTDLKPPHLHKLTTTIRLDGLDPVFDQFINSSVTGRIVVDLEANR